MLNRNTFTYRWPPGYSGPCFYLNLETQKPWESSEFTREAKQPRHGPVAKTHVIPEIMSNWSHTLAVVSQVETLRILLQWRHGEQNQTEFKVGRLAPRLPSPAERLHVALSRLMEWQRRSFKDSDGTSSAGAGTHAWVGELQRSGLRVALSFRSWCRAVRNALSLHCPGITSEERGADEGSEGGDRPRAPSLPPPPE